ncbi:MAG: family 78 glycoside hydrolase catalytic domain, partial [Treponema sp.]|nr:family 78 glycoside hydrolase catalytic domain [Treponema sp.]
MNIFTSGFDAKAVWLDTNVLPNRYGDFIHDFSVSATAKDAKLYISADTEYVAYLNGRFVDCGQYDDYPDHKAYDILDVSAFLVSGPNRLCIRAYHQGTGSCQYKPGLPLLVYALLWDGGKITSGDGSIARQSKDYVSGPGVQLVSTQLSYSFEYNADKDDSWLLPGYKPGSEWTIPHIYKDALASIDFYERPVKKLVIHPAVRSRLAAQGLFQRQNEQGQSLGELMYSDFLGARPVKEIFEEMEQFHGEHGKEKKELFDPWPLTVKAEIPGAYLILDMGEEEAGFFTLKVNAPKGTVIDIAYGEHLDDLRVRSHIGNRNFCFSYTCREGEQEFTHYLKRIAGRYLELHIHNLRRPFVLYYAGLLPVRYPLEKTGIFNSPDMLLERILKISERTLELCLHEHYEDCPWREQGLYAFDSRNQMLS